MKQEFTVKGMVELVGRVARQLLSMAGAGMKRYRETRQKGYAGGFESFNTTGRTNLRTRGGLVDVSTAGNAVAMTICLF